MRHATTYILSFLLFVLVVEIILINPTAVQESTQNVSPNSNWDGPGLSTSDAIEQSMQTIHVVEARDQNKEWELWADNAIGYRDSERLDLRKVKADFFSSDGMSFNVVGGEGILYAKTKNVSVGGSVVTKSSNGYIFKTEGMNYNSSQRILSSPTAVEVAGPREKNQKPLYLKGSGMEADMVKGIMLIQKNVRAEKTVNEGRSLIVSADLAQLSGDSKVVKFSGNVNINLDGVEISGPDALFQYDSALDLLSSIELVGGVKVSDKNKSATSNQLKINLADNKYVFEGNPKVVQDEDEVSGERIIFLDGGKKVKIEKARVRVRGEGIKKLQK